MKTLICIALFLSVLKAGAREVYNDEEFEVPDFSYVLLCKGELISSVRQRLEKSGLKIPADDLQSLGMAIRWSKKQVTDAGYPQFAKHFDDAGKLVQGKGYYFDMEWRDDVSIIAEHLDLPEQIEGCSVEPLWVVAPGQSKDTIKYKPKRIGRTKLMLDLKPIDLLFSCLPANVRSKTIELLTAFGKKN